MALERRNPLPNGTYWVDMYEPAVGGASITAFQSYLKENTGNLVVLKTVYHGPGSDPFMEFVRGSYFLPLGLVAIANQLPDVGRARAWILFQVKNPILWPAIKFGFPTVAIKEERTDEADTVSRPEPEKNLADIIPPVDKIVNSTSKLALTLGGIAALAAVLYIGIQSYFVRKIL